MNLRHAVGEEYRAAFENYKITFDHAATLTKFFATTAIVVLGGLSAKAFGSGGIAALKESRGWVVAALLMLLMLGVLSFCIIAQITRSRGACIRRMNYLRKHLLKDLEGFDYEEYIRIAGFSERVDVDLRFNWSILAHASFILTLVAFVLITVIWVMTW